MTALRQRMIEDMQVRNYSPRTVEAYVAAVAKVAKHFQRSPDQLTNEDVRAFQVHLLNAKTSWSQFNQIVSGLRFFFGTTLARPGTVEMLPYGATLLASTAFRHIHRYELPATTWPPHAIPSRRSSSALSKPPLAISAPSPSASGQRNGTSPPHAASPSASGCVPSTPSPAMFPADATHYPQLCS